ncbi:MAG: carbamoyltransferase HypF [Ketobacter sp.]|nr:MAG: carbamoyltransferase HypF [Ketobacter sp.]
MTPGIIEDSAQPVVQRTIHIRGVVQGVGMRPAVWHLAQQLGLAGYVRNDADGVLICCRGSLGAVERLISQLQTSPPPQARISGIEHWPWEGNDEARFSDGFVILDSHAGAHPLPFKTGVAADMATCPDCLQELFDPDNRRYRYPFINCTHCGPRLSIVGSLPYDRANTSMAAFELCAHCQREFDDPQDRRFHAQPNACPKCGPMLWVTDHTGAVLSVELSVEFDQADHDPIAVAQAALRAGKIVAIKAVGGFQLAVDACNESAVARLRQRKHRPHKPLALMARDLDAVKRFCRVSEQEQALLQSAAAPLVLLDAKQFAVSNCEPTIAPSIAPHIAPNIAPMQRRLGVMLPSSPLHHLLLETFDTPLVMTSGNSVGEPQCISNHSAFEKLAGIADLFLLHDRDILNRVDDSVVQVIGGQPQILRRGRGDAPLPLPLPPGFDTAAPVLALGADLKNTFCLLGQNGAVLSQHMGDLQEPATLADFANSLALYQQLYRHQPHCIAVDAHPQYHASQVGRQLAQQQNLPLVEIQHHHAHMAACLGEHGWPLCDEGKPVLAITLDGLGYAPLDQRSTLWGGEILLGDYASAKQLACLKPVPLPGGNAASVQPWRNTVAQLHGAMGWHTVIEHYGELAAIHAIAQQPVATLVAMMEQSLNSPLSSSCGRLFDAVAGLLGFSTTGMSFEGQAAMALEAAIGEQDWQHTQAFPSHACPSQAYPFALQQQESGLWQIDPAPMWHCLLQDLKAAAPSGLMAARFHQGLARALAQCAQQLARRHQVDHVVLSGGVFQNRHLTVALSGLLQQHQLTVLTHSQVPANDGGIAFGQALIAAANMRNAPCA